MSARVSKGHLKKTTGRLIKCHGVSSLKWTVKYNWQLIECTFHQSAFKYNSNFVCLYTTDASFLDAVHETKRERTTQCPAARSITAIHVQALVSVPPFGCIPLPSWRCGVRKTAAAVGALPHRAESSPTRALSARQHPLLPGTQPWVYLLVVDMHLKISKCPLSILHSSAQTSLLICGKRRMCLRRQFRALFFPPPSLARPDPRRGSEALSLSMCVICLNCTSPGGGGMNYKIGLSH